MNKARHSFSRDVNQIIGTRRSKRAISEEPIGSEKIETIVSAAHLAPSCFNNQPWRLVLVQSPERLKKIKDALPDGNYWARKAPLFIAVTSAPDMDCQLSWNRVYFKFDCGLAVENLLLQATDLGLVAHPIAGFDPSASREVLEIPDGVQLITFVVVGKPGNPEELSQKHRKEEETARKRKPLEEVVTRESYDFEQEEDEN